MGYRAPDLKDRRFGRLVVQYRNGSDKHGNALWYCLCDCGNTKSVPGSHFKNGHTQSCGCLLQENCKRMGKANRTHGHSVGGRLTTEYKTWESMLQRCYNPHDKEHWKNYGGRGIRVCDSWNPGKGGSFQNFLGDMGLKPAPEFSIDREDTNGDYTPKNCQWATMSQQVKNRRKFVAVPKKFWIAIMNAALSEDTSVWVALKERIQTGKMV
jgi:hypothetical protein